MNALRNLLAMKDLASIPLKARQAFHSLQKLEIRNNVNVY